MNLQKQLLVQNKKRSELQGTAIVIYFCNRSLALNFYVLSLDQNRYGTSAKRSPLPFFQN